MTVLIYGLDGLDVNDAWRFNVLDPQRLTQDFEGANALWTYRVWPCIFSGEVGGASDDTTIYEPENDFVWERHPATVLMAPVQRPPFCQYQETFPDGFREGTTPPGHIDQTLEYFDDALHEAFHQDVPLVIAVTRLPDILQHTLPDGWDDHFEAVISQAEYWCSRADEYLVVSDHGFDDRGGSGIDAHSRRAIFDSSFCEYDTMTGFCVGWHADLDAVLRDQHLEDLGYSM